jgi:hypothetical protein
MSVRVNPGDGPSYELHDPTPGSGPAICADCVHVDRRGFSDPQFCKVWTCGAVPVTVLRVAGVDPITGESVSEMTTGTSCTERNNAGECKDFTQRPPRKPVDGSTIAKPPSAVTIAFMTVVYVTGLVMGLCIGAAAFL